MTSPLTDDLAAAAARAAEAAAFASFALIGRGDEKAADQAAVDAMRTALNSIGMDGTIVIGEGERDEAPMLYIGEKVGTGRGPSIAIALDPLEGTTLTAKAMPNALTVLAMAASDGLLHAPDVYMDKIAIGPGYPENVVDLDRPVAENLARLAQAKAVGIAELCVCVLDRPRHQDIIAAIRAAGASIALISDGDVAGVINTTSPETGIDLYLGTGGAPEGVLAAAALRCMGGQFQGRLHFRNEEERARARRIGVEAFDRKYSLDDLVPGDAIFAATGVTGGSLLAGVARQGRIMRAETLLLNSATRSRRIIRTEVAA